MSHDKPSHLAVVKGPPLNSLYFFIGKQQKPNGFSCEKTVSMHVV